MSSQITVRFSDEDKWIHDTLQVLVARKKGMGFCKSTINSEVIRMLKNQILNVTTGNERDTKILKEHDGNP